jgi:competence protein ComEA
MCGMSPHARKESAVRFASITVVAGLLALSLPPAPTQASGIQTPAAVQGQEAKAAPLPQINLNTAPADQLERLPGVGASTAARIIEYRQKNGGFKKIEEIMNVRGIGEKTFLKMKNQLTVTPPKASPQ